MQCGNIMKCTNEREKIWIVVDCIADNTDTKEKKMVQKNVGFFEMTPSIYPGDAIECTASKIKEEEA